MRYRDYASTYRCAGECGQLLDDDEFPPQTVKGRAVCHDCCEVCELCGEYLNDDEAVKSGPLVRYALPESEGRYSAGHASCVGQWILGQMAGIPRFFDVDDFSKVQIHEFYAMAQVNHWPMNQEMQSRLYRLRIGQVAYA